MGATVAINGRHCGDPQWVACKKKTNECQRVEPQQSVDRSGQSVRRRLAGNHEQKNGLNNAEPIGLALISCGIDGCRVGAAREPPPTTASTPNAFNMRV